MHKAGGGTWATSLSSCKNEPKKITQKLFDGKVKAVLFVNRLDTFPCIYKACQISFCAAFRELESVQIIATSNYKQPVSVGMEYQ